MKLLNTKFILIIFSLLLISGCVGQSGEINISNPIPVNITSPVESNGGIPVNIQDQHSLTSDLYFSQVVGVTSSLTLQAIEHSYNITVTPGHGIITGDQLVMFDIIGDRLYIGNVLNVLTNTILLDTPVNYNYSTNFSSVVRSTKDMNVDGSTNRQTFQISPPIGVEIDITRVMFQIITDDFPELDMFGDISGGLVRGVVLRAVNGQTVNYFNVKTNGELVNLMYDVSFYEAAKHGVNGLGGRLTYGGQSKHGVTIRLGQGDTLEAIVQDDLTSLNLFRMIGTFHIVTD